MRVTKCTLEVGIFNRFRAIKHLATNNLEVHVTVATLSFRH